MERLCRTCEKPKSLDQFETVRKSLTGKELKRKDCNTCRKPVKAEQHIKRKIKKYRNETMPSPMLPRFRAMQETQTCKKENAY